MTQPTFFDDILQSICSLPQPRLYRRYRVVATINDFSTVTREVSALSTCDAIVRALESVSDDAEFLSVVARPIVEAPCAAT